MENECESVWPALLAFVVQQPLLLLLLLQHIILQ